MSTLHLWAGSRDSSSPGAYPRSPSVLKHINSYRAAYYILWLLFPFLTRTDEEDIAAWAIVGHEENPTSTSSTLSQDGVEKSAGAA